VSRPLGVIGVPTSAGAFAPGQEQAPRALREAGLVELLHESGVDVRDHGEREVWRWRPDRANPRAQNIDKVIEIVKDTARRVGECSAAGEATLVLGGDCTVGIGSVAGHVSVGERVGLVYFDTHADLNIPPSVPEGALDRSPQFGGVTITELNPDHTEQGSNSIQRFATAVAEGLAQSLTA
jgi:arginase